MNHQQPLLHISLTIQIAILMFCSNVLAQEGALKQQNLGDLSISMRHRFEYVDQDGFGRKARSSTLRTSVSYLSPEFKSFQAFVEGENVSHIGADGFNDTTNQKTEYPVVADPDNTEFNQAYLSFKGIENNHLKAGRQKISWGNQRFIGPVGWRQNHQSFDSVLLSNDTFQSVNAKYAYIYNVNRIFGEDSAAGDFGSKSHIYQLKTQLFDFLKFVTYGFMLDFGSDSPANSSHTTGFNMSACHQLKDDWHASYYFEYAYQDDYGSNATQYNADYYHISPSISYKNASITLGYEVLGSDDRVFGFRTPLATGHAFNGYTDKFLNTPNDGLRDIYIAVKWKHENFSGFLEPLNGLSTKIKYHDFSADKGSANFGKEWSLTLSKKISKNYNVKLKFAQYDADDFSQDTKKVSLDFNVNF